MGAFVDGLVAGYGIAIPVGAIAVLIVDLGARRGFGVAFAAGLGTATADLIYATIAAIVGVSAATALAPFAETVRIVGVGALLSIALWIGILTFRPRRATAPSMVSRPGMFGGFLALTMANPLTLTYFAALVLGRSEDLTGSSVVLFVGGAFLASLSWQTLLAGAGAALGYRMSHWARKTMGIVGAGIIVALALRMLLA